MPHIPPVPTLSTEQLIAALILLGLALLVGLLLGYLLGALAGRARSKAGKQHKQENEQLRAELERAREEHRAERRTQSENFQLYRGEVRDHFAQTGQLMTQMVDNYRQMYDHLASGAENLADMRETRLVSAPPPEAITQAPSDAEQAGTRTRAETDTQSGNPVDGETGTDRTQPGNNSNDTGDGTDGGSDDDGTDRNDNIRL